MPEVIVLPLALLDEIPQLRRQYVSCHLVRRARSAAHTRQDSNSAVDALNNTARHDALIMRQRDRVVKCFGCEL